MTILSPRWCSATVATTFAPATTGVPMRTSAPSPPTISTRSSSTSLPASADRSSTSIVCPTLTRYCLLPVSTTAYTALSLPNISIVVLYEQYGRCDMPNQAKPHRPTAANCTRAAEWRQLPIGADHGDCNGDFGRGDGFFAALRMTPLGVVDPQPS